ncbi:MAG TPA: Ig-like domain-containing protein [Candidatus Marinimicrobia bacterium]|nr:Ig-like domain-containing protein [Candidatus Neomarinimicrobiota bacterium]HRS50986.1 Ig-like domain-containing protein [Candidatus Neomarinimicrobiota bacterium]HRU91672.1 Ig-like domain-containing protein [Candidatus Neomarinimicrobiota bacterium]
MTTFTRPIKWTFLIAICAFLVGCAAQGGPGGGPVDRTGPVLLSSFPQDGATNIDLNTDIVLHFSEPIDARMTEGILQVTPRLSTTPQVKIKHRKVIVELNEPLQPDRTYIFNFGHNMKDYQNNATAQEIKIAFATGDSLDQGTITGVVTDIPTNTKTQVWFYKKNVSFPDTLWLSEPDYIVSVDKDGNYQATNLPVGEYRALAISGERPRPKSVSENDLLAPPQTDQIIIKNRNDYLENINFRLAKRYLKPFRLINAKPIDGYLELDFSRPLTDTRLAPTNFIFSDEKVIVKHAWVSEEQPTRIILLADSLSPKTEYQINVSGIRDVENDTLLIDGRSARFNWTSLPDTLGPKIISTIPSPNSTNVELSTVLQINLSEPVYQDTLMQNIALFYKDTVNVAIHSSWIDANSFIIEPEKPLISASNYSLQINSRNWRDYSGNFFQDSLIILKFNTIDQNLFGSVSGKIISRNKVNFKNLVIEAQLSGSAKFFRQTCPDSIGFYQLIDLLPGKYKFSIWEDRNCNGKYDFGRLSPYLPAESYRTYSDEINVRSRWETAEVNWVY